MEVGRNATAGKHYIKRLDTTASRRGSCRGESWKDLTSGRIASTGRGGRSWNDGIGAPPSSITPLAQSVLFDNSIIDKVLFQDLVEMIPLVESLMDHHYHKSFPRHASLIYTSTPPRDPLMLKKAVEQKGKRGHSQFIRGKGAESKDGFYWESAENMYLDRQDSFLEEIPMLSFPMDHQADQNAANKDFIGRLQGQIEQLEQKLQEKENQLHQAVENRTREGDLVRMQAKMEELQRRMVSKEKEIEQAFKKLLEKQHEVASLQTLLQNAQAGLDESNLNFAKVHADLDNLQCQVASFIFEVQRMSSSFDHHSTDLEQGLYPVDEACPEEDGQIDCHIQQSYRNVELTRRKYLACLIAAREIPTEESLSLIAELRAQLQDFLMQPDVIVQT